MGQNESAMSREAKENAINFYKSMYPSGRIPRDMQTKINHLEEGLKYPRWTVSSSFDDTVRGTITHEYGHIMADQYFGQINGERYLTIGADEDWKALNYGIYLDYVKQQLFSFNIQKTEQRSFREEKKNG